MTGSFERDLNFGQYIDGLILPEGNLETVFSLIPGISTVLFGVLAGRLLLSCREPRRVMAVLAAAGIGGIGLGFAWSFLVPLNKILWSSSFAVYAGGWSCLAFLLFYWAIEVKGWRKPFFPLIVFGMNAIALYMATGLFVRWVMLSWQLPWEETTVSLTGFFYRMFAEWATPTAGSLLYSALILTLAFAFGFWMYRRRLFLKV